ncbi:hypothetical protein LTR50_000351 [Elasticomyces elasticus]|nr:hypothetical protein LTR50_000351 [Elasticomyces elasticus]
MAVSKVRPIHVGIIGAGFAGMRCADMLLQRGMRVTIIEARDRVGGRVAQSNHLGHLVDLGPNWIHGTENNPILELAKQTGTVLHSWGERQSIFDRLGKVMPAHEATEYAELFWGIIADAFRYSNEHSTEIPASRSLIDFVTAKAREMFHDDAEAEQKRQTLLDIAQMWGAFVGGPANRQSLRFFWLEECIEGENPFVAETYAKILDKVQESIRGAEVRLNEEVTSIGSLQAEPPDSGSHDDHLKNVIVTSNPTHVLNQSEAETIVSAFDEVVVTCPLGWLKGNKGVFTPELEPSLLKAIDAIGYGTLDKVYITFPSAFWNEPVPDQIVATPETDERLPNVAAASTALHQRPTESATTEDYPGFTHWISPHYANSNPDHWDQQGCNLAALPPSCAHPTLLFYIYGPCGRHIADLVKTTPEAELDDTLYDFFNPYYSRLPNYSASDPACRPKAVLATAWANDRFAGYGSYSNFQIGLEEGDRDIECMRHGMPERHIWFAGEHTAPFVALGTSTGAYWSGEAVANRIVKAYGMDHT